MSSHDDITPVSNARSGGLNIDQRLVGIEELLREIRSEQGNVAKELAGGRTQFETLSLRLRALEVITYGACGLGLIALAGAVIAMVVRGHP